MRTPRVAYTGNPNPATLAHFTTQLEAAKAKWNQGVDEIWTIAGEHGAYRLNPRPSGYEPDARGRTRGRRWC
jgi:hypothetical protein